MYVYMADFIAVSLKFIFGNNNILGKKWQILLPWKVQSEMNGAIHTSQRLYSVFLLASGRRQFISLQCFHMFEVISLETTEDRNTIKK